MNIPMRTPCRARLTLAGMLSLTALSLHAAQAEEWKTARSKDGKVEVVSRISARIGAEGQRQQLIEYSATTTARVGLENCVALLKDAAKHKDFLDDEISKRIATVSDSEWVLYYYSPAPWPLSDFDCVTRMRYSQSPGEKRALFTLSAAPALLAPGKVKRISHYEVAYEFEDLGDGKTLISMRASVAPTIKVPAWMLNSIFPETPADILRKIAKLAAG